MSAVPSPATHTDVVNRWRPLDSNEQTNATTFLDDAWREIRRRMPDIAERIAATGGSAGDLHHETVRVLVTAVLRVMKNPDGTRRESMDNSLWEPNQAAASGLLEITDADLAALQPVPLGYVGGAFTVGLG